MVFGVSGSWINNVAITGNVFNMQGGSAVYGIAFTGGQDIMVSGNQFLGGTYGIAIGGGATRVTVGINSFSGTTTNVVNGSSTSKFFNCPTCFSS